MSRVIVSGADGFTGRYLAPALRDAGHEVHGLVWRSDGAAIAGAQCVHQCDLADAGGLLRIMREVRPTKVVHLAGIAFVAHEAVEAIYTTNIVGTRNLLEALVVAASPVDTVLLASSANVYGNFVGTVIDEQVPPAPVNDYAVSKLAMEFVARLYADRLPIVVTRPFNYTGVGQAVNIIIPKIVDHVRRRARVIELGNLDVARDFSDVRAIAESYRRLAETPAAVGEIFNICSGRAYTIQDVLDITRDITGHELEVRFNPDFARANELKVLRGSRAKLDAAIGWFPAPDLTETLRWMLEA
jgi:GDP-6-deoxy-D-talose 4-dehydrogenase